MARLFTLPTLAQAERNPIGGIQQVMINTYKHLQDLGWEFVDSADHADVRAYHATDANPSAHVLHCHGLYPTGEIGYPVHKWQSEANRRIIQAARVARFVTVPSEWVADIFRRDMHLSPVITQWAVDREAWAHDGSHDNYILWNKNRTEGVCTPEWINRLARSESQLQFVSTFGEIGLNNLRIIGAKPYNEMREIVKRAAVYLATTKETGDIGSREALAAGIPVLGFRHGATPDFVIHGYNGFLAAPNDFDGLLKGLHYCLRNRDKLSKNAIESAKAFDWRNTALAFHQIYSECLKPIETKISVVIPVFNYEAYLAQAIESVLRQETHYPFEVIVVDDGSTDNSVLVARQYSQVKLIQQANQGVAHARNAGIEASTGNLIACLDADDVMGQGFVETCGRALEIDPTLGIAYTGLKIMGSDHANAWPTRFDYRLQVQRENRVPSLCMFRKEAWQRVGGFRQYMHPAEDADLWTRITASGYNARQVTDAPLHEYRMHARSASSVYRGGQKPDPFRDLWINYHADGMAAGGQNFPVRNYDNPVVTFIVKNASQHTLDSIEGQTFKKWEIHLTGTDTVFTTFGKHFIDQLESIGHVKSQFIVFLESGDVLHPLYLEKTLAKYRETGRYVYTDWMQGDEIKHSIDWSDHLIDFAHPMTVLMPIGTMDINVDYSIKKSIAAGVCGARVPEVLVKTSHVFEVNDIMCSCLDKKPASQPDQKEMVFVTLVGEHSGNMNVKGKVTNTFYGRKSAGQQFYVYAQDLEAEKQKFVPTLRVELPTIETTIPAEL